MSWASTQREDEIVDLWPEHAEHLIGAMEFSDESHKAIVLYLDIKPLGINVNMVTYMSWKSRFTGWEWMSEVWRGDALTWGKIADPNYNRVSI